MKHDFSAVIFRNVNTLRQFIRETLAESPANVITPEYAKKEAIRATIQKQVYNAVKIGKVFDQASLEKWFKIRLLAARGASKEDDIKLAITSLKVIPFQIYKKLVDSDHKPT